MAVPSLFLFPRLPYVNTGLSRSSGVHLFQSASVGGGDQNSAPWGTIFQSLPPPFPQEGRGGIPPRDPPKGEMERQGERGSHRREGERERERRQICTHVMATAISAMAASTTAFGRMRSSRNVKSANQKVVVRAHGKENATRGQERSGRNERCVRPPHARERMARTLEERNEAEGGSRWIRGKREGTQDEVGRERGEQGCKRTWTRRTPTT
eukprot:scaffold653_cov345-Pavlova_lutheri.AAC.1